jgi:hypothetical protein
MMRLNTLPLHAGLLLSVLFENREAGVVGRLHHGPSDGGAKTWAEAAAARRMEDAKNRREVSLVISRS